MDEAGRPGSHPACPRRGVAAGDHGRANNHDDDNNNDNHNDDDHDHNDEGAGPWIKIG
jgi:hypothetical protein